VDNSSYNFVMRNLISYPFSSLFALVDGLQYERHYGEELKFERNVAMPFFNTWPDSRIAFAGPWLLRLNTSVFLRERINELSSALPSVSWIVSSLSSGKLVKHISEFLNLQLPDGRNSFFRIYDPRVLADIKIILEEADYDRLISCCHEWASCSNGVLTLHRASTYREVN